MWTPHIAKQYPNAKIYLMADCGAGIVNEDFLKEGFSKWNVFDGAWPSFVPGLNPNSPDFAFTPDFINDIYTAVGEAFPNITLSQFNTMGDGNQIFYYALMNKDLIDSDNDGVHDGVEPSRETIVDWLERMPKSMDAIEQATPNFKSYLSMYDDNNDLTDGTGHCIIFRPEFYDVVESGVALSSWLDDLVNGHGIRSVEPTFVPPYETILQTKASFDTLSW